MRIEILASSVPDRTEGEVKLDIGAVVARSTPAGGITLELGPADGAPHLRIRLSSSEATRLSGTLRGLAGRGGEEIFLTDDERA